MLVDTRRDRRVESGLRNEVFRFNANWVLEKGFEDNLKRWWSLTDREILEKLEELGIELNN